MSASSTISGRFDGVCSSILPRAAISFSCCDAFFLPDKESLLAMFRNLGGEVVDSLFVMSFSTFENTGVVGVIGDLGRGT